MLYKYGMQMYFVWINKLSNGIRQRRIEASNPQEREYEMIENDYRYVSFDGAYDDGENLYISCQMFNGMLRVNKETCQAEYICRFEKDSLIARVSHHKVYKYKQYMVFAPDYARGIYVYDLYEEKWEFVVVDSKRSQQNRCIDSIIVEDKLWLFYAYAEHPVVILDLNSFEVERFYGIAELFPEEIAKRKQAVFLSVFQKYENRIYGVIWKSPYIVEINLVTKEVAIYNIEALDSKITALAYDGINFWLVDNDEKCIIQWRKEQGIVEKYAANSMFDKIVYAGGKIILLSANDAFVYWINEEKRIIEVFCELPIGFEGFSDVRKTWRRVVSHDVYGNVVRMYPGNANMMLDINVAEATVKGYKVVLRDDYDDEWYKKTIFHAHIKEITRRNTLKESTNIDLKDFLGYISSK